MTSQALRLNPSLSLVKCPLRLARYPLHLEASAPVARTAPVPPTGQRRPSPLTHYQPLLVGSPRCRLPRPNPVPKRGWTPATRPPLPNHHHRRRLMPRPTRKRAPISPPPAPAISLPPCPFHSPPFPPSIKPARTTRMMMMMMCHQAFRPYRIHSFHPLTQGRCFLPSRWRLSSRLPPPALVHRSSLPSTPLVPLHPMIYPRSRYLRHATCLPAKQAPFNPRPSF